MNILANNLIIQLRMFKKAKEKRSKLNQSNNSLKNEILKSLDELSNPQNLSSDSSKSNQSSPSKEKSKKILISDLLSNASFNLAVHSDSNKKESCLNDLFFDLEAEREKGKIFFQHEN